MSSSSPILPSTISTLYPIRPGYFCDVALCSPLSSLTAAQSLIAQSHYIIEEKYDGVRVQVHWDTHRLLVFGRSGEVLMLFAAL